MKVDDKHITEQLICEWLSSLGRTRATSVKLADVRRLLASLTAENERLREADAKSELVTLANVRELAEYSIHDKWRCKYYQKCHCGLDELCDQIGLERIPYDICV